MDFFNFRFFFVFLDKNTSRIEWMGVGGGEGRCSAYIIASRSLSSRRVARRFLPNP